jgi:hypothetical protein
MTLEATYAIAFLVSQARGFSDVEVENVPVIGFEHKNDVFKPGPDLGGAKGANAPGPPDSKGPPAACSSVLLHEIINNRTVLDWIMTACTSNLE